MYADPGFTYFVSALFFGLALGTVLALWNGR